MGGLTLISTIAIAFGVALVLGFIAEKLHFPALVGYLIAGVIASPKVLGFDLDMNLAEQLSEIGIMLLMFGVGLHFSITDLLKVKGLVIPGALCQMLCSGLAGFLLAKLWGWPTGQCIVLGMCVSCASTVVVLKALEARGMLEGFDGRVAVGWLIVQDMVAVLMLVLLPPLASVLGGATQGVGVPLWKLILLTAARVAGFFALMLVVGKRLLPWVLWQVAKTGSRELFTLCVLAVAIGIAFGASQVFEVSAALGAFVAGMVMRESEYAHRAATESLPLRDAFSVIFFVGVGMMFDPSPIIAHPFYLICVLLVIAVFTPIVAIGLVLLFRYPLHTAVTLACCLSQIGEFSFILGTLGVSLKLMSGQTMDLVLAAAIVIIAFNPITFATSSYLTNFLIKRFKFARVAAARPDPHSVMPDEVEQRKLKQHVVIVGYGVLGRKVTGILQRQNIPVVIVDKDDEKVEEIRKHGTPAIQGESSDPTVLLQAHIQNASQLVITISDEIVTRKIVETAKILNPSVECIVQAMDDSEAEQMRGENMGVVVQSSTALARQMSGYVSYYFARSKGTAETAQQLRKDVFTDMILDFVKEMEEAIPADEKAPSADAEESQ